MQPLVVELGTKQVVFEDDPHDSWSSVNAGLVDEISAMIVPLIDGCGHILRRLKLPRKPEHSRVTLLSRSSEGQDGSGVLPFYKWPRRILRVLINNQCAGTLHLNFEKDVLPGNSTWGGSATSPPARYPHTV